MSSNKTTSTTVLTAALLGQILNGTQIAVAPRRQAPVTLPEAVVDPRYPDANPNAFFTTINVGKFIHELPTCTFASAMVKDETNELDGMWIELIFKPESTVILGAFMRVRIYPAYEADGTISTNKFGSPKFFVSWAQMLRVNGISMGHKQTGGQRMIAATHFERKNPVAAKSNRGYTAPSNGVAQVPAPKSGAFRKTEPTNEMAAENALLRSELAKLQLALQALQTKGGRKSSK